MVFTAALTNLSLLGETFRKGEIRVNDDGAIDLYHTKRSLLGSRVNHLGHLTFDASTITEVDGERVRIGEVSFEVESPKTRESLMEILTKPRRVERARRGELISSANTAILTFLMERSKAMDQLRLLRDNPRLALFQSYTGADEVTEPIAQFQDEIGRSLEGPFHVMEEALNQLREFVDDKNMRKVYTLVFGVAAAQTASYSGSDLGGPLHLLEKVSSRSLDPANYVGRGQGELTKALYMDASIVNSRTLLGE